MSQGNRWARLVVATMTAGLSGGALAAAVEKTDRPARSTVGESPAKPTVGKPVTLARATKPTGVRAPSKAPSAVKEREKDATQVALAAPSPERRDIGEQRLFERVEKFDEATRAEARGQLQAAMRLYQDAAVEGYGPAQRRLGNIYQSGNAVVQRDYEIALLWFERARANGEKIVEPRRSVGFRTGP